MSPFGRRHSPSPFPGFMMIHALSLCAGEIDRSIEKLLPAFSTSLQRSRCFGESQERDDPPTFDPLACNRAFKQDEQLQKEGRGVRVVGRLKQDRWTDADGKPHSRVLVVAEHVEFKPQLKKDGDAPAAEEEKPAEDAESEQEEVKEAVSFREMPGRDWTKRRPPLPGRPPIERGLCVHSEAVTSSAREYRSTDTRLRHILESGTLGSEFASISGFPGSLLSRGLS
jgi:single-strand DNA-binding protein